MFGSDIEIITINLGDSGNGTVVMKAAVVSTDSKLLTEHLSISTYLYGHEAIKKLLCRSEELLGQRPINADTTETSAAWNFE